jgi:hypothetical protein
MKQKRIFVPTRSITDWKTLLAEPDKQWEKGHSAMLTALSWENGQGLPPELISIFRESDEVSFQNLELAVAIPEYQVPLKGGNRPSQNDVFALVRSEMGLIALTVEGKGREDFGPTLNQWQHKVSEKGYQIRLKYILENIGLSKCYPLPGHIRYQLLHRTASAVIEAKRFHCESAVMIVQSFVEEETDNHFMDYHQFLQLYDVTAGKDKLIFLKDIDGIRLYSAWSIANSKGT